MYDRIVIAVDGSDEATHAARRGLELARAMDATVEVVHVVPRGAQRLARTDDERAQLRDRGHSILDAIEELASDVGQPVSTELTEGTPAVRIVEFATDRNADLVVVGRQGTTGVKRRLLGGVAEQVLHRSAIPVFVVPPGDAARDEVATCSRVLVPTDGSDNAEAATSHAVAIGSVHDATVHVLNVVDLQAAGGVFNAGGLEREFVERLEERGRAAVEEVANVVEDADVECRTAVERTDAFEDAVGGIRDYVEVHGIDLVVMGSHGRSNLGRQLLGSVAASVLRTVDVPMLVVTRTE